MVDQRVRPRRQVMACKSSPVQITIKVFSAHTSLPIVGRQPFVGTVNRSYQMGPLSGSIVMRAIENEEISQPNYTRENTELESGVDLPPLSGPNDMLVFGLFRLAALYTNGHLCYTSVCLRGG